MLLVMICKPEAQAKALDDHSPTPTLGKFIPR